MLVNVYTCYDDTKTIIGKIRVYNDRRISENVYKKLLKNRTIGGDAGIYTDAGFDINVINKNGDHITIIR